MYNFEIYLHLFYFFFLLSTILCVYISAFSKCKPLSKSVFEESRSKKLLAPNQITIKSSYVIR